MIVFELPVPPSVNSIWRQGNKKVYLNPKYVSWVYACDVAILADGGAAKLGKIEGRFGLLLEINEAMIRKNRDLDNCAKVVADYCRRLGLIEDDNLQFMRRITVQLDDTPSALGCRVTLSPML